MPVSGRFGFGTMLAVILVVYASVVVLDSTPLSRPVPVAGVAVVLLIARRRLRRRARPILLAIAVALTLSFLALFFHAPRVATTLTAAAMLAMVTAATAMIAAAVWRRPIADAQSVAGALAVYLLLALFFATLHQLLGAALNGRYLNGVNDIGAGAGFLYFSAVTITTVGFGDITPACAVARGITMTEALTGQLYLVAVVGAVVGNWGNPSRRTTHPAGMSRSGPFPGDAGRRRQRDIDEEAP